MKSTANIIKQALLVFGLMVGAITLFSFLPTASAQLLTTQDNPLEISAATGGETSFRALALTMINFFLTFLGFVAVVMVIYGGITYVTAAGRDEPIGNAKKIITYAIVGIIIILLSFAIINTVLGAGTGTEA